MKQLFISIFLVGLLSACITGDDSTRMETIIINNCDFEIKYITYPVINNSDTIKLSSGDFISKSLYSIGGSIWFPVGSDSVKIIFNSEKYSLYDHFVNDSNRDRNPFTFKAYKEEEIGKYHNKYTYTITVEDYNNAIPIK